ncbi:Imm7 family immunity protein [Kitasatospora sp. NPDC057223]|uniref:Imm7 family immunity protein n=1 Tax=Kitasatospora sp. NPDC057223 TaxID=3346055 RepID=UPI00362B15A7
MFGYHGWISVQESATADDDDYDDRRLRGIVECIERRIREMDSPYLVDLRWMNGQAFIHFGGVPARPIADPSYPQRHSMIIASRDPLRHHHSLT